MSPVERLTDYNETDEAQNTELKARLEPWASGGAAVEETP